MSLEWWSAIRARPLCSNTGTKTTFEGDRQTAAQSCKELENGRSLRLQDAFHNQLASWIHHGDGDRCLMNIEADILFTGHKGAPSCRSMVLALINLLQRGALL